MLPWAQIKLSRDCVPWTTKNPKGWLGESHHHTIVQCQHNVDGAVLHCVINYGTVVEGGWCQHHVEVTGGNAAYIDG